MKFIFIKILFILFIFISNLYPQGSFTQTSTSDFNQNTNFNINTKNDEMKLSVDVGNGADGDLYVPVGGTFKTDDVKTYVVGNNPSGQNSIKVNSTAGFSIGDEVLIITMIDKNNDMNNNLAGQYEFKRITYKTANALLFSENLKNVYDSTDKKHQVIKVKNYNNVTVDVGGNLTCDDWDGSIGGIIIFRAKGIVQVAALGKIDASYKGYRGGPGFSGGNPGKQGEGITGIGTHTTSPNFNGGGGGGTYGYPWFHGGGGGGGSYGSAGTAGSPDGGAVGGTPGNLVGTMFLTRLFLGSGGGSGGNNYWTGPTGSGGDGGGIIFASADSFNIIGYIYSQGENGGNAAQVGNYGLGGGGAGSGGSIYLISNKSINLGNNFINALGGQIGGLGYSNGGNGGRGGNGRIRIDAPVVNGSSNPAVGFLGTSYAFLGTSITPPINKPSNNVWGELTYNKNTSAPGTSVLVDILSSSDSVLLANISSGTNLTQAGISNNINSIKLRARLINIHGNQTPILYDWSLNWNIPSNVENNKNVISTFALHQNYPNPYNPTTVISYQLPFNGEVSLKVYDVLGNEVATLVDEYKEAGKYEIEFNAVETHRGVSLSSGVYLYKLRAGEFVQVKKMILLK